jgi:hypothetical protein
VRQKPPFGLCSEKSRGLASAEDMNLLPILVGDPGMIQTCGLETWRPFFEVNDVKVRRVANVLHREVTANLSCRIF